MAQSRTLKLGLLADVAQFGRGLNKASKDVSKFGNKSSDSVAKLSTAFKGLSIAASYALVKIGKESVTAASDLNEELSKTSVIFGETSADMKKFAKAASTSLGMSTTKALKAAGTFAILGKAAGITGNGVNDFSKKMVTLSADLASFYNTSPEDAITAIGSALRGESEPIRKYGVLLSQAALEQYAYNYEVANGVELARDSKNQLTDTSKVLARYQGIVEQSAVAQGDFSRTSESMANQQRILSAGIENAKASFGEALLPAMVKLVNYANDTFIPKIQQLANGFSGKPDSVSNKLKQVGKDLGYAPDSGAYNLGKSLRDIATAMGTLISTMTGGGAAGSASNLQRIADALESMADAIDKVSAAWNNPLFKAARKASNFVNPLSRLGNVLGLTGSRAAGGTVRSGGVYRVGEFGPETLVMNGASGSIRKGGGAGGNTFIFNGVIDGESARRSIERLMQDSTRRTGSVNFAGNVL